MGNIIYLQKLITQLIEQETIMLPCSEEEINHIAKGKRLPIAFVEFLQCMGRGTGGKKFMKGEDCYYEKLLWLTESARELLSENDSGLILSEDIFVFFMSQGCLFCFFKLDEGDNPPVYLFSEAREDRFYKIAECYTDFLVGYLTNDETLFDEISDKENGM